MDIEKILLEPIGKSLSSENWESFVYELGTEWVYKEIKTEHGLAPSTPNLTNRITLQRYWCSDTHFQNVIEDFKSISESLSTWLPETHNLRAKARFSDNPSAIITIQKKITGVLLAELPNFQSDELTKLTTSVKQLCAELNAPMDFHPGNIIIENNTKNIFLVDTGTPSDWKYLLDVDKLQTAIEISVSEANEFVLFMSKIHEKHWVKSTTG